MNRDPFELYQLPPSYTIDKADLESRYHELQKKFHPDRFSTSTTKEKQLLTQLSADIVSGYKILLDPVQRAVFLLNKLGYSFSLEDAKPSQNVLMEQLLLREKLATLEESCLLENFEDEVLNKTELLQKKFTDLIGEANYSEAGELLLEMRFYQKLHSELKEKKSEL